MPSFKKNEKNSIEPEVDGHCLTQPCEASDSFAAYFKSVFISNHKRDISTDFRSSDFLRTATVCDSYCMFFCKECFQWFKILPCAFGNSWHTRAELKVYTQVLLTAC